jgi:hypothetical protein
MKRILLSCIILCASNLFTLRASAQCGAGWNNATVKWDNLDYLVTTGTYAGFVTPAMRDTQNFAIGVNRLTIQLNGITPNGENTSNTAGGAAADAEFANRGTMTFTFDTAAKNLVFNLYDIDSGQQVNITARDPLGIALPITLTAGSAGILTITGSGTNSATATASMTVASNTDTRGTVSVTIPGNASGIASATLTFSGVAGNFWLGDLTACIFGSFPINYYAAQTPWIGQPAYYLVTPDNNSVYLFNPLTGKADMLFSEPASPWVNSLAYDYNHRVLFYVMDHSSPVATNHTLKKYDFNTETIGTVVNDLTTVGIPLFDIVVESAGAAYYNGSLYLGIEGTNTSKNSNRESIIWRIDFDASLNIKKVCQVFASPADNGAGLLTHDWGDFTIKDGTLYDFNTGNVGSTSSFIHYNLQTGTTTVFPTNGNPAPIQAGQTYDGTIYWTGGQSPELGRVAKYNEDGTIGAKIVAVVTPCSPAWVGRAGDASDPFRPKSDFGDAPASYDPIANNKATHEQDCNLRLGPTYDREWDKTPSANATGDGSDEDGIGTPTILLPGIQNYVQDVKVYNNTGTNATVVAWLDYNGNGVFDPSEGVSKSVPTNAAMQTITLQWTSINVPLLVGSHTFLRVRVTSSANNMSVNTPNGWFANGEVEDYYIPVNTVLPVQLLQFNAANEGNTRVLLTWSTAKEENFSGFDVERSTDGFNWERIGNVSSNRQGGAQNNYSLYDHNPALGTSFYRLRLIGDDGNYKYSDVRQMNVKLSDATIRILPNPIIAQASMEVRTENAETARMKLVDASGKTVAEKTVTFQIGVNRVDVSQWHRNPAGVYMLYVVTPTLNLNAKVVIQ